MTSDWSRLMPGEVFEGAEDLTTGLKKLLKCNVFIEYIATLDLEYLLNMLLDKKNTP